MSDDDKRQMMLLIIECKLRALNNTSIMLVGLHSDPTVSWPVLDTQLGDIDLETSLLQAKQARIEANFNFNFPDSEQINALRKAISDLETLIAKIAAVEAVINASNTLIATIPAKNI